MRSGTNLPTVFLVWDGARHEGQELRGVYATRESAERRAAEVVANKHNAVAFALEASGHWRTAGSVEWVEIQREEVLP